VRVADQRPPEQLVAISTRDRDVFCEAGAGTGKTSVLVGHYCDAVTDDGVTPDAILAITFTERAAGELRTRIRAELLRRSELVRESGDLARASELATHARDSERAWISTIHGFCRRLLASHPLAAGLDPRFRVVDEPEADRLAEVAFEAALEEVAVEREAAALLAAGFRVDRLRDAVRSTYEHLRGTGEAEPALPRGCPPQASANGEATEENPALLVESYEALRELLVGFGRHYERLKDERSGLDFEDLQLRAVALLAGNPRVRGLWQERFSHLLVDEFQDTNRLQVALLRELQGPETRLFTVGDEQQSVYGFRDADLDVFREERERARAEPGRELIPLSGNFRSRPEILAAVNALGEALLEGFRPLSVGREHGPGPRGGPPAVELLLTRAEGWDAEDERLRSVSESPSSRIAEARFLAGRLRELADAGVPRGEIVVLLRAFTHVGAYEEALARVGLAPYVVGGRGYWSHQQVEDLICLLSTIANPLDDERLLGALASAACAARADALWLLRRIAGPHRHLWPVLERHFGAEPEAEPAPASENGAGASQPTLFEDTAADDAERERRERAERYLPEVPDGDVERLRRFCATLAPLRADAALLSLEGLIERTIDAFDYDLATLARDGGERRMANLRKLMRLARDYEAREGRDLRGFLDYAVERATAREDREGQAATEAEGVDGVRVMTVHAAKGLEFPVVAVADLGRDLISGPGPSLRLGASENGDGQPRIGVRLSLPGRDTVTLGELKELADEQAERDAAEELRLGYVAATRAEERLILSGAFKDADLVAREDPPARLPVIARLLPALGVTGEDGQSLRLKAPRARPGLDAEFSPAELAVRVCEPTSERLEKLGKRSAAPDEARGPEPTGAPPLVELRDRVGPAEVGALSYSALSHYSRCGYRFYVERVLGLAATSNRLAGGEREVDPDELVGEADLGASEPGPLARERRFAFGSAVHALLEWSARNRWRGPGGERCEAALRQEGLAGEPAEVERALAMTERWLGSELCRSLDRPLVRLHPEAPFLLSLGDAVVRGKIDLLAELADELLVVDYKSDAVDGAAPAALMERYEAQRALYAIAAREGIGQRNGGAGRSVRTAYAFLAADAPPVERAYGDDELAVARKELERLVAGIEAERFEVTSTPHRALCFDCPARERLCSHPPERTMAAAPPT
jgi:ATP-dependent helicase/nuclease subunit A